MRIKKIQLKNGYKRFYDLTIDLGPDPKRIVALVGPNGCGKSSVLDGMLFLQNSHNPIGAKGNKQPEYHSMHQKPSFDHSNVTIEFLEGNYKLIVQGKSKVGKEKTIFSFRSPYRYNQALKVTQIQATDGIRLNAWGATFSSDIDDKMEYSYRRLHGLYNDYLNANDCRPSEAKAKIIGDLNQSLSQCLDLEVASLGNVEANKGTLYFKKSDQSTEFDFNVLSSGEKEVVDILLDLYLRREDYDDSVFLIDEPELHINTSVQRKLLLEVNRLVGKDCQIWITTHSIGFLRALQDDLRGECQIIQFKKGVDWATSSQVLKPMPPTFGNWRELFETALDDIAGLVSPKRIIYCEGRDQPGHGGTERGLDARVFNRIFSEKYPDTVFVSSGGNTELDKRSEIALAILTKVFSEIEIYVLKDRDISSGKITSEADRLLYLENNPDSHRVLARWEIENYLYDIEVLQAYCGAKELPFNQDAYDRFVTNIVDQNLKDDTGRIKTICGITTSVNPEKFKLSLADYITEQSQTFLELENCIFGRA